MEGKEDRQRFAVIFERLAISLQKRFKTAAERADTVEVYFANMADLPIAAVEAAGVALCKGGSSDGWFPRCPEWEDAAIGLLVQWEVDSVRQQRALPASPAEMEADLVPVRAAKAKFVAVCRERGWDGMARVFEQLEIVHPSKNPQMVVCELCSDTGSRMVSESTAGPCECRETNPMIRARRLEGRRTGRLWARKKRAAELNPRGAQGLLN